MVQFVGPKRHLYTKFWDSDRLRDLLQSTGGKAEYRRTIGKISCVRISTAGMEMRRVRISNLPQEMPAVDLRTVLATYGELMDIQAEAWSSLYRYLMAINIRSQ
jgi:hypothetical protein